MPILRFYLVVLKNPLFKLESLYVLYLKSLIRLLSIASQTECSSCYVEVISILIIKKGHIPCIKQQYPAIMHYSF